MEYRTRLGTRRLRALWLVPAALASAVGGGVFTPTTTAHAAGTGTVEVCKSSSNGMTGRSFNFTVSGFGSVSVLGGGCSGPLAVPGGATTIQEAATSDTVVQRINSKPAGTKISQNLAKGTVKVMVASGGPEVVVTYTNVIPAANLKVCKQAASNSSQLVGQPFSFTVNRGAAFTVNAGPFGSPNCSALTQYAAGSNVTVTELAPAGNVFVSAIDVTQPPAKNVTTNLSLRTASLTLGSGVNIVTYTNQVQVSAQPGFLEICKAASDQWVHGNFSFSVTDAAGTSYGPFLVTVGQCSSPIQLSSGPATITEAASFPYFLGNVSTQPADRLISTNLTNQTATVNIVAGDSSNETLATFTNDTQQAQVKVCKTLSSNSNDLTGTAFTFNYSSDIGIRGSLSIVAAPPGQGACKLISQSFPLGSHVSITENGTPNVQLTGVSVSPSSADNGSTSTTANLTVQSGIVTATFNNMALGTLEICKNAYDPQTYGKWFNFVINGSINISVEAGFCSPQIQVPAGTATVLELSKTHYHLYSVTATGPTGDNRLISGPNPATVSVPFGGVGNETVVTFTNAVDTGQFKICKTTSDPSLDGQTFQFSWNYTVDNTTTSGTVGLMPGQCSGFSAAIPVLDSAGNPVQVNVTESATPGDYVQSITYAGNGSLVTSNTGAGTSSFDIGFGSNIITYDNEYVVGG